MRWWVWLIVVVGRLVGGEPDVVYLTWLHDPTSTMTVQWQADERGRAEVVYRERVGREWKRVAGEVHEVEGTGCFVHVVEIEGLEADKEYVFKIDTREYRFRTMPRELDRPVRFVVGGDAFYYWGLEVFHRMNRMIGYNDPDFVVIGGDLAYTNGKKRLFKGKGWTVARWQLFLRELQKTVKGKEGRMIPILPVVGNHDVKKGADHQMFYEIFAFPEKNRAYRAVDFGRYLSLVLLDTGHTAPIAGAQTEWLAKTLEERQKIQYRMAAYHVAAYPGYYPFEGAVPSEIRKSWVPLFEKFHLPVAFEHHNHCLKRTYPLKEGKCDPSGVTYLGDGSWAIRPRAPKNHWYLARSASVNSCYVVTLTKDEAVIEAKDAKNEVIDRIVFGRVD